MADYRKFLGATQTWVAPFLGGRTLADASHRVELDQPPARPGWFRVTVRGRAVQSLEPTEPGDLSTLPAVRGCWLEGRLVTADARAVPVHLPPADEPARFSPLTARRWYSGELLFDAVDFETEAQDVARQALAQGLPLTAPGVPAELRAAFALALLESASRHLSIRASPGEVRHHLREVAEGGSTAAERVLRALEAEREVARREWAELQRRRAEAQTQAQVQAAREQLRSQAVADARRRGQGPRERATLALERAGAVVESVRLLAGESQVEVVYTFEHERLVALADAFTLQVLDAGICLGHPPADEELTLDSLPAVVKEAVETGALVQLRWP